MQLNLRISGSRVPNGRQYELPSGTDLASLIPGDFEPDREDRDIIVNNSSTGLTRITSLNPLFDSLHFPLLFPHGDDGFHTNIRYDPAHVPPKTKRQFVTQREYYCFRIQYRSSEGKTSVRAGKALQHYCIDAFTIVEQNRLTYLHDNQKTLRSETYNELNKCNILLLPNCAGSVRYMKQLFLDGMAICHYFGNPDLFITFEFQKRGLPHVHILVWLAKEAAIDTTTQIDTFISAELPDPMIDPIGYAAATKFMLHGPCGVDFPKSPCMIDDRCKKFFPKPYTSETTIDDHGYAVNRRRMTGITAIKSGISLDNRYVVPYNRYLIVKYQAHINIEVCHKGKLIKYLFKYITKGPDRSAPVHSIVGRPSCTNTMLTQWFLLNQRYPSARNLTYDRIPNSFVWSNQCKDWSPRKNGFALGRIPSVPAACGDVFYLRILLGKIPGALSFQHLRTVNGVMYSDYQLACQAMGLLATDDEWDSVMLEVSRWGQASIIRSVFVSLLIFCQVADPVASSEIAATLLPDGVTAHSRFKIPLEVDNLSTCMVKKGTEVAELLKEATLIVWDEAPMVHRLSFEAVDRTLCDLMNTPLSGPQYSPFGGKTVLLGGDFRQTLPVVPKGSREDNINASLPRSYLWNFCTLLHLHVNMRINSLPINTLPIFGGMQFSDWVLAIGNGTLPAEAFLPSIAADWITVPSKFLIKCKDNSIEQLIRQVYPSFQQSYQSLEYIKARAIVTPTNAVVSEINNLLLDQIPGSSKKYFSADSLSTTNANTATLQVEYPLEFLNSLSFNGVPEHILDLKPYVTVMLLRNINPAAGMCNGTRILLTHLGDYVLRGLIV
ncbi:hypothetical protein LINPERPRIM_LOCUS15732 [Linum perenne]